MKKKDKVLIIVDMVIGTGLLITGIFAWEVYEEAHWLLWLCIAGIYLIVRKIPPEKAPGSKEDPSMLKLAMVIKTECIGVVIDISNSHGLCYGLVFPNLEGYYGREKQLTIHWFDPEDITFIKV